MKRDYTKNEKGLHKKFHLKTFWITIYWIWVTFIIYILPWLTEKELKILGLKFLEPRNFGNGPTILSINYDKSSETKDDTLCENQIISSRQKHTNKP